MKTRVCLGCSVSQAQKKPGLGRSYLRIFVSKCPLASHRCKTSSGSTGISPWTKANERPFSVLEPIDEWHQVFNLRRALKLRSHEQLPTVDKTLHCDRFSSLRPEKTEDTRNGGKTHENEAVFFGSFLWGGRGGGHCLIRVIVKHNTKLR